VKTWTLKTYTMIGLQGLVLLGGLVAAANMAADDTSKQKVKTPTAPLIHSLQGPDLYRAYCASCHGVDAKGNGPVAPALKASLPDLTTIAQRNGGIFPAGRVRRIIAGDEILIAHGTREMPVWGPIFHQIEEDRDYGAVRLQNLTVHLESLQKK
jgi:mono/diheme cytochrome c family protein